MTPSATNSCSESAQSATYIKLQNIGVFTNPEHELYIKKGPVPAPGPGECLIHVRATGICGSDVHFWKSGHIGDMIVVGENRLGHESAGVVVAVGEGVDRFKLGISLHQLLRISSVSLISTLR
jgi:D-arabinose 1-dehydrogenase-like Zn-dependent alcohol dehydrogenase